MTEHEQGDIFGGSTPLDELDLTGHSLRLANAERDRGRKLTGLEAGALIHAARGQHPEHETCHFCESDGTAALIALNTHRHRVAERARKAAEDPPWRCEDCGHDNPAEATFCRGCASTREDDREPKVRPYDPERGEIPF